MSVSMLSTFVKPMHPEGRKFVAIFAGITVLLFLIWEPLGWIGVGLTGVVLLLLPRSGPGDAGAPRAE